MRPDVYWSPLPRRPMIYTVEHNGGGSTKPTAQSSVLPPCSEIGLALQGRPVIARCVLWLNQNGGAAKNDAVLTRWRVKQLVFVTGHSSMDLGTIADLGGTSVCRDGTLEGAAGTALARVLRIRSAVH